MPSENEPPSMPNPASAPQFQFVHESSFAPVMGQGRPSKTGVKGKAKWSSVQALAEALRLPGHVQHIENPLPPISIYGIDPGQLVSWHNELVAASKTKMVPSATGPRRQRRDTPVLLGVVASFPGAYDPTNPEYLRWRELVTVWVLERYGKAHVAYGLEHADETTGHLHFGIHNFGASVKPMMAGPMAVAHAAECGVPKPEFGFVYKRGCQLLQDQFYEKVGRACGLGRLSPNPRSRRDRAAHLKTRAAEEYQIARVFRDHAAAREMAAQELELQLSIRVSELERTKVELASRRGGDIAHIRLAARETDRRTRAKLAEAQRTWQEASAAKNAMVLAAAALQAENERREKLAARREQGFMQLITMAFPDPYERTKLLQQFGLQGRKPDLGKLS